MKVRCLHTIYNVVITLSVPFALVRLWCKGRKTPDYRNRVGEHLARFAKAPNDSADIWLHSVSVGEFLACQHLIERLLEQGKSILVTTTTPTGAAMVGKKLGERVRHHYLPFDTPRYARRFIEQFKPKVAVFIETEIWPNYLYWLRKNRIPSLLINARLSEKSYRRYRLMGAFTRHIVDHFCLIGCQNVTTQKRFNDLGANAKYIGNLKFDLQAPSDLKAKTTSIERYLDGKPFILVASTHPGEDELVLNAFKGSAYIDSHRLIIAPRHPERSQALQQLATARGYQVKCYTAMLAGNRVVAENELVIIDTLGELLYFYALAEMAIIGGSFVPNGGHNPLEAALFSTPCFIGEHYFNFESLVNDMQAQNAIRVITSAELFKTGDNLVDMGANAHRFLIDNQGACEKYQQIILKQLP